MTLSRGHNVATFLSDYLSCFLQGLPDRRVPKSRSKRAKYSIIATTIQYCRLWREPRLLLMWANFTLGSQQTSKEQQYSTVKKQPTSTWITENKHYVETWCKLKIDALGFFFFFCSSRDLAWVNNRWNLTISSHTHLIKGFLFMLLCRGASKNFFFCALTHLTHDDQIFSLSSISALGWKVQ